jgi:type II secretory ATPase GspE/PulE/Tfp pilus assembly ATPase PilB-like protein
MEGMTAVPLSADDVDVSAYADLREACLRHGFLPTFCHDLLLEVGMIAPGTGAALAAARKLTHQEVRSFEISEGDFDRAVALLEDRPRDDPAGSPSEEPPPRCPESWECHRRSGREVAAELVRFAYASGASDLLLDQQEAWMDVALKVDGRKEMLPPIEQSGASGVLKAFKQIAGLSTQAVAASQSGAASFPVGGDRRADLRIEIVPTVHGESLAARIQDRALQLSRMRRLPFAEPGQRERVAACLAQHQGLILATGPTGHGKSTTLYACLGQLDRSLLNIRTLEDPVEFIVPWITQIPVGAGTGRDFGAGLKSLLRQAPHVILLGEIRDAAAAQTCAEAVDTGHLILSTLHTRNALGTVSRLLDLGLTGRQIASSLLLVIGQRLMRRLCPHCRRAVRPTPAQCRHFAAQRLPEPAELWIPGACGSCGERGERGLAPVFELLHPPSCGDLAERIGRSGRETLDEPALRERWLELGGSPLVREGLRLAAAGEVTYAEVQKYEGTG